MSERGTGTRTQEHEIAIDAPIESVWKAITDAEELTRWFVEAAKVEPGAGGTMWISWGGAEEGRSRIDVWEPNQRLRLALMPFEMGQAKQDGQTALIDEYTLERRDGKTVLRLVCSGIPDSPEWDGFYNGTDSGWRSFFRTMRHYLEHHAGKPRTVVKIVGRLPLSLDEAWTRLTGPDGLGFGPVAGNTFSTRTGSGEALHGDVVFAKAPGMLELNIRELDDAFLAHAMASSHGQQYVYSVLSLYGKAPAEVEALRAKWQTWLTDVLGVEGVPAGAAQPC
jgi:uncharacterized protein YndB with AHSA1/START domain